MKRISIISIVFFLLLVSCPTTTSTATVTAVQKPEVLRLDPAIKYGVLPNGLRYYVRANAKPEKRVEMRLVVNAGSILEDDGERGIAHFLEHLAFDGTLHFKKDALINTLETMGMSYGNDLNAATGYDETVYRLQVPTDDPKNLDTGLLILEDWAHNLVLDPAETDNERKVITEEWRSRLSGDKHVRDKQLETFFYNSRYAARQPIGDMDIVKNCPPETLMHFYRDWYRPDLEAVIVVGNVDPELVEKKIKEHFQPIQKPANPRPRVEYAVPPNNAPLVAVVTDKEATISSFQLYIKRPVRPLVTIDDYRSLLVEFLFHTMLSARLDEISRKSDSPFMQAFSSQGLMVRTMEATLLGATAKEGMIEQSLDVVLQEVERVKRFGFTPAELAREKKNNLSSIEKSYNERDKRQSAALAQEYIRLYLNNEASPGIEYEYELYKRFIPEISLEEINRLFATIFPEENRVLLVGAPERKDIPLPDSTRLLALFASVKKINLEPYQEAPVDKPLVSLPPQKGSIVKELQIPEVGITEWQLSNGVRVILKPTNFKNDEIVMRAFSPGGSSLVAEKDYVAAVTAADLVAMSGIGDFSRTELEKKLAGKEVGIAPSISELATGVSGSATPKDFETLCELVWLYFTAPKIDPDVFLAYKEKLATVLAQRRASPETVFFDMLQTTLTQDHFRTRPWTPEILSEFDIEASLRIYKDRFSDAGNFSFIFVGNFTPDSIRPFIETYIAGLPSSGRRETWKDSSITRPPGVVERTVQAGKDPKSMAAIVFHGEFPWQLSEVVGLHALAQAVEIRLTDVIRREEGGTYGLGVDDLPQRLPRQEYLFYITFGADPVRVDSLTAKVLAELHDLTTKGVTAEETAKTKEILLKEREVNLAGNTFWAGVLVNYYLYGEPPARILDYSNFVKELTPETLTGLARKYLREDSYVKAVLYPEESKK